MFSQSSQTCQRQNRASFQTGWLFRQHAWNSHNIENNSEGNSWQNNNIFDFMAGCQISGRSDSVHPIFPNGFPCSSKMGICIAPIKIKIIESVQRRDSHIMLMDSHSSMWRESVGLPRKISYLTACHGPFTSHEIDISHIRYHFCMCAHYISHLVTRGPSQSIYRCGLTSTGIPMLKIRRSRDLSLTWESPYLGKTIFILKRGPGIHPLHDQLWSDWT